MQQPGDVPKESQAKIRNAAPPAPGSLKKRDILCRICTSPRMPVVRARHMEVMDCRSLKAGVCSQRLTGVGRSPPPTTSLNR